MKRFLVLIVMAVVMSLGMAGCATDADVASRNLSKSAEMFEIDRRIVFYNGITDNYILSIEGRCSVEFHTLKFEVTCKTGVDSMGHSVFKKHYLGRADNVFPFIEQLDSADVSTYRHRVIFKPATIIPDIDVVL